MIPVPINISALCRVYITCMSKQVQSTKCVLLTGLRTRAPGLLAPDVGGRAGPVWAWPHSGPWQPGPTVVGPGCLAPQWGAVRAGPATNGLGNSHSQKHRPRGRTREKRPPVSHLCPLLPHESSQEEVFAKMRGPPVLTSVMAPGLADRARSAISSVEKQGRKKQ